MRYTRIESRKEQCWPSLKAGPVSGDGSLTFGGYEVHRGGELSMGMDGTLWRGPRYRYSHCIRRHYGDIDQVRPQVKSDPTVEWPSPGFRTRVLIDLQRHPSNTYVPLIPNYPALLESFVELIEKWKTTFLGFAKTDRTRYFDAPGLMRPDAMAREAETSCRGNLCDLHMRAQRPRHTLLNVRTNTAREGLIGPA